MEVLRLLGEGLTQNDIADVLKLTKGRIAQIRNEAISSGLLTQEGDLTPEGERYLKANNG